MSVSNTNQYRYATQERGDRIHPSRFHSRYWHFILLYDRLKQIVNSESLASGNILLDYGCGNKPYESLFKRKFPKYLGADFPGNLNAEFTVGPQGQLPLEKESVDCVLSTQVLEHVEDPAVYLLEANRVLKAKGSLVLSTHGIWHYHPDPTDYWRWTIDGLQSQIRRAGFEIIEVKGVFGKASSAVQLWQDATSWKAPRLVRPVYIALLQLLIGLIERNSSKRVSNNASVYVVLARKA